MLYGWVAEDNAERIDNTDGDGFKEGDYYFGGEDDGAMTTGWLQMDITYDEATNDYEIAPVFNEDEDQTRWFYFQSNGKKVKAKDGDVQKSKTINGKKYEFDVNGAMTAEWSLDVEKASKDGVRSGNSSSSTNSVAAKYAQEWRYFSSVDNGAMTAEWSLDVEKASKDGVRSGNSSSSTNSVAAKYAQEWRYFSSVEDGARVSKGWFKVVAAEYLNYDKYNDDEDAWYYADGSGNLYAGEFKTIKGKKYAFRDDGRMVSGLKFIKINKDSQNKVTGLTVKADDDDNHPFDDEDRFDESALWYARNGYDCYYFGDGDDGAMRTNKTSVTIDGDNYNFYFEKSGGNKGAGVTDEKDDKYYQSGKLVRAGSDEKYQVVQFLDTADAYGYDKLEDAAEFKSIIEGNTEYTTDDTVNQANIDALGINKKVDDIQEIFVIKRADAAEFKSIIEGNTEYTTDDTVNQANIDALGINKKVDDIQEIFVIKRADGKVGTDAGKFFLVNTSGKVIDSKSKNKDGNDYQFVVAKGGSILGYYVED